MAEILHLVVAVGALLTLVIGLGVMAVTSALSLTALAIYLAWGPHAVVDAADRWLFRRWP